jgi:hypothetical protein
MISALKKLRGGTVSDFDKRPLVRPSKGINAAGDSFFTDGGAYILYAT